RQAIQNKLDRIVLDEAFFDGVALPQVLNSLSEEAARRDPDKEGINFLINPMPSGAQTTIDPATGQQIALPPPEPLDMIETLNVAPQQITIEPKFMEMPTDAAPTTAASQAPGLD